MLCISKQEYEKKYKELFEIGSGAFGRVIKALDKERNKIIAIKIITKRNEETKKAVEHEVIMMKAAESKNVVKLLDSFELGKEFYIAMEFCGPGNISQHKSSMNNDTIAAIARDTAKALINIHDNGMIHLDIKPQNILLTTSGDIKLCDFGVMRKQEDINTASDVLDKIKVEGTLMYIAPEILNLDERKKGLIGVTPQADIYSLGMSLFEMIAGVPLSLTKNNTAQEWFAQNNYEFVNSTSENKNKISKQIANLIIKMLSTDPEERPTAREIEKMFSSTKPTWMIMKSITCKPQRSFWE